MIRARLARASFQAAPNSTPPRHDDSPLGRVVGGSVGVRSASWAVGEAGRRRWSSGRAVVVESAPPRHCFRFEDVRRRLRLYALEPPVTSPSLEDAFSDTSRLSGVRKQVVLGHQLLVSGNLVEAEETLRAALKAIQEMAAARGWAGRGRLEAQLPRPLRAKRARRSALASLRLHRCLSGARQFPSECPSRRGRRPLGSPDRSHWGHRRPAELTGSQGRRVVAMAAPDGSAADVGVLLGSMGLSSGGHRSSLGRCSL